MTFAIEDKPFENINIHSFERETTLPLLLLNRSSRTRVVEHGRHHNYSEGVRVETPSRREAEIRRLIT